MEVSETRRIECCNSVEVGINEMGRVGGARLVGARASDANRIGDGPGSGWCGQNDKFCGVVIVSFCVGIVHFGVGPRRPACYWKTGIGGRGIDVG